MKRKIALMTIFLAAVFVLAVRIWAVNKNADQYVPQTEYYPMGTEVDTGQDLIGGQTRADGYSVKVINGKAYSLQEFQDAFGIPFSKDAEALIGYYLVDMQIANHGNAQQGKEGIPLLTIGLLNCNYLVYGIDENIYYKLNPDMPASEYFSFSLKENSSIEITVPYKILRGNITQSIFRDDLDVLKRNPPYLELTAYPHRKLLATH